jgi:hypothetical protein
MIQRPVFLRALALFVVFAASVEAQPRARIDQSEVARQLLTGNGFERGSALVSVRRLGPENVTPRLRAALITALEREGRLVAQRRARRGRGEMVPDLENPELIGGLAQVVAAFRDPWAIRALTSALGNSPQAIHGLAEFGELAAPSVLQVVRSTPSMDVETDALMTLRFMADGVGGPPLTGATRARMREVAKRRLTTRQKSVVTVWRAIDLAVALQDAQLRWLVQRLASDRNAVMALGVTEPDLIDRTQRNAAERLAGVPALPRHVSAEEYARGWK